MPVSKDDVAASLAAVAAPDGTPLSATGRVSDIVASDGKVFFSINVDAAAVQRWEAVRKAAEAAVRALPGVSSGDGGAHGRTRRAAAPPKPRPRGRIIRAGRRRARRALPRAPVRPRPPSRACPASTPSSRSPRARAASANPRPRSISRSACAISASRSACSTPTSTARRCRSCSAVTRQAADDRRHAAAPDRAATASRSCRSAS